MKHFLERHRIFILFFGLLFALTLAPLFTFKQGFVKGDYGLQFLPWSFVYAAALKAGHLELWTPLIGCGFPLFAEGQTAMLYPLNLFLFYALPFHIAYNAVFLLHFLLAGVFCYLFARNKALTKEASAAFAIAFCFGSNNAGGFLNLASLRSLVWFPLALFCVDRFEKNKDLKWLAVLSLAMGQSWLGGSPQTSLYAAAFIFLYACLKKNIKNIFLVSGALAFSMLIGLPQIWATLELAGHSTRTLLDKDFVFWGSASPLVFLDLFFSSWGVFLRTSIYISVILLILVLSVRKQGLEAQRAWILTGFAFLMALGRYNPLYWLLAHLPGASLLRNPSKFLFFAVFFLALAAAFAFDRFCLIFKENQMQEARFVYRRQIKMASIFAGFWVAAWCVSVYGQNLLKAAGDFYLRHFVLGKSFHSHSPEQYFSRLADIILQIRQTVDWTSFGNWWPIILSVALIGITKQMMQLPARRKHLAALLLSLVALDLYFFVDSGKSFKGNIGDFPDLRAVENLPKDGRWLDTFTPNQNMLTKHAVLGAYAPLLDKEYFLLMQDFGVLDDSFGLREAKRAALTEKRDLLNFLGAGYLPELNEEALPEFTLEGRRADRLQILKNTSTEAEIQVEIEKPALLTRNQVWDSGWKVFVNGKRELLQHYKGVFQAVELKKGASQARFVFEPAYVRMGLPLSAAVQFILLTGLVCAGLKSRQRQDK